MKREGFLTKKEMRTLEHEQLGEMVYKPPSIRGLMSPDTPREEKKVYAFSSISIYNLDS